MIPHKYIKVYWDGTKVAEVTPIDKLPETYGASGDYWRRDVVTIRRGNPYNLYVEWKPYIREYEEDFYEGGWPSMVIRKYKQQKINKYISNL